MTPQVARIDAHHLRREEPTRLCYMGTVLRTQAEGIARSRSPLQIGIELYGHAGIESDLEVLELMIETLHLAGCEGFTIDLGHVQIYRSLVREARLSEEQEHILFEIMQRKAKAELLEFISTNNVTKSVADMLLALAELHGDASILDIAEQQLKAAPEAVANAITQLRDMVSYLQQRHPNLAIHFDLAELRGYHYHTGVIFAAYMPGHGQAVAMGGRYDHIGEVFGRARPATGFSTDMRTLNIVAKPQTIETDLIWAPADTDDVLRNKINELRAAGESVITELPGQSGDAKTHGCRRKLDKKDGDWQVVSL
jgi:ATP phosphoribosyltransferase regulatory subunit